VTIGLVALSGTAQVFIPTAGALFWKRSTTAGAVTGLLAGVGILVLLTFVPSIKAPLGMHSGLFSLIANLVLFVVVSLITPKRSNTVMAKFDKQNAAYNKNFA
jgi:SSS family solute:Na+ symporter